MLQGAKFRKSQICVNTEAYEHMADESWGETVHLSPTFPLNNNRKTRTSIYKLSNSDYIAESRLTTSVQSTEEGNHSAGSANQRRSNWKQPCVLTASACQD